MLVRVARARARVCARASLFLRRHSPSRLNVTVYGRYRRREPADPVSRSRRRPTPRRPVKCQSRVRHPAELSPQPMCVVARAPLQRYCMWTTHVPKDTTPLGSKYKTILINTHTHTHTRAVDILSEYTNEIFLSLSG